MQRMQRGDERRTTARITVAVRKRVMACGQMGDTFNQVLNRLLDDAELCKRHHQKESTEKESGDR